jgi:hypothetical protein
LLPHVEGHATIANVAKLPQREQVWGMVCAFADRCKHDKRKNLYTLAKYVPNKILDVDLDGEKIRRHSERGGPQTADITRLHVDRVWDELTKQGWSTTKGHPRVFTHALMLHALPQFIEQVSPNTIRLRSEPSSASVPLPAFARDVPYDPRPGRRSGGEGPLHRALRMYIFEEPDNALVGLEHRSVGKPEIPIT